ncbi:unnamed protein product [Prorocentrum cordatum]|uniref:RRM domain-containing protein n=1 Tax=Prorocentrum cordatum TaxID=2364126 RepID=A0ABN9VKT2_9DINO|nr:unnamed protein product [Polarella glacialis]
MATQLVSAADKGGILVDASAIGRPVGDTSSSACYVTDLPKNFHGGEEALHWSLGELFGQYGKIKKIELYMEEGILETQNFKGEALIVYHRGKLTGSHDKGDPVWDACTDMDGKYRLLGKKMWRMRVEAATWQREGYDVKDRAKRFPCVEIGNLWEYVPAMPLAWFGEMQEVIRLHAAEHIEMPFVKVEPTEGKATVWCKGAQDAMKFASIMHKSYFLGRKVQTSLCRKPKPVEERLPRLPKPAPGAVTPGGQQRLPELSLKPKAPEPEPAPAPEPTAEPEASAAPAAPAPEVQAASAGPAFQLKGGCRVTLRGLVAKPQNNGLRAEVIEYLAEAERYQVRLEDGRCVKLKRENLEVVREDQAEDARALAAEASEDESDSDEEMEDADGAANAQAALVHREADERQRYEWRYLFFPACCAARRFGAVLGAVEIGHEAGAVRKTHGAQAAPGPIPNASFDCIVFARGRGGDSAFGSRPGLLKSALVRFASQRVGQAGLSSLVCRELDPPAASSGPRGAVDVTIQLILIDQTRFQIGIAEPVVAIAWPWPDVQQDLHRVQHSGSDDENIDASLEEKKKKKKKKKKRRFRVKEATAKKGMALDSFFMGSFRRRGTDMCEYLANKDKPWGYLQERDETATLSDDVMADFPLDRANFLGDQKRNIILNSGSEHRLQTFQHALGVNFDDVHEKEERTAQTQTEKHGGK